MLNYYFTQLNKQEKNSSNVFFLFILLLFFSFQIIQVVQLSIAILTLQMFDSWYFRDTSGIPFGQKS